MNPVLSSCGVACSAVLLSRVHSYAERAIGGGLLAVSLFAVPCPALADQTLMASDNSRLST